MSLTLYFTPRTSVRPRNDTIYPTGGEGQEICGVFSENDPSVAELERFQLANFIAGG